MPRQLRSLPGRSVAAGPARLTSPAEPSSRRQPRSVRRWAGALAAWSVTAVVTLGSMGVAAAPAGASGDTSRLLSDINSVRSSAGVGPLSEAGSIDSVALNWAQHMAGLSVLSHNLGLDSVMPGGWGTIGENVAFGPGPIDSVHMQFVNSPHHYANLVDGRFTQVGLGIVSLAGVMWVVEDFWGPKAGASATRAQAAPTQPAPAAAPRRVPATTAPTAPKPTATTAAAPPPTTVPVTVPAPAFVPTTAPAPTIAPTRSAGAPPSITAPATLAAARQPSRGVSPLSVIAVLFALGVGAMSARRWRESRE